jgi:hypothetical protein
MNTTNFSIHNDDDDNNNNNNNNNKVTDAVYKILSLFSK